MNRRTICMIVALIFLSACATDGAQRLGQATVDRLHITFTSYFLRELGKNTDFILSQLGEAGGFLADPRVRILLPPPMGLALGITGELIKNPEAALLEVLINQAAEQAIPGAGPILRQAITSLSPERVGPLLRGEPGAVTDLLKSQTERALVDALTPSVSGALTRSGAERIYSDLIAAQTLTSTVTHQIAGMERPEPPVDLTEYVTGEAIKGLFNRIDEREQMIRLSLPDLGLQPRSEPPRGEQSSHDSPTL